MGAAASIKMLYGEAVDWFKQYFDTELYVEDFRTIDKDKDGGINYDELQRWIKMKAFKEGGSWKSLLANPEVIQIAHEQACIKIGSKSSKTHKRVFDVTEFRLFLMHLFSISVLWVHFKNADQWEAGYDIGNDLLNLIEFRIAVQTLCRTHANEEISDEQLAEDFKMLDTQSRNHIGFLEVCDYCCRFIDPNKDQAALEALSSPSSEPSDNFAFHSAERATDYVPVRRPSLGEADGTGVRVPARRPSYGARDGNTTPMHRASFALREAEANSVKTPARRPSHQFREELKEMPYQMLNDISSNYSANIIPEQRKLSINEKNEKAMDAIAQITNLNRQSAEFLSIKISTEEALIKMKSDAPIRSSSVDAYETQTMQPFHQSTAVESIQSGVDSLRVVDGTNEKPSEEPVADSPQRTDGEISNLEKPAVVQHADAEGNANVDNKETNESVQHDLPKPQTPQSKRIEKVPVELE